MLAHDQIFAQSEYASSLVDVTELHWKIWKFVLALIHYSMANLSAFSLTFH